MMSLERQRVEHLEAARYLLRQLRSCGDVWSDGRKCHRGESLAALRKETLSRVIRLKNADREARRDPAMHRLCKNLMGLPGAMRQRKGEAASDWLSRLLVEYCGSNDSGSRERAKVVRRLLRRISPAAFEAIPEHHRYGPAEMSRLRQSRLSHNWTLGEDYRIPELGFILPKGVEVTPTMQGFCARGLERPHVVPSRLVRKTRRVVRKSDVTAVTSLRETA